MMRSILAVVVGAITAGVIVAAVEGLGHVLMPPPPGISEWKREQIEEFLRTASPMIFVPVLLAWIGGAFGGGFLAAWIAQRAAKIHAGLVAGLILAASIAMLVALPHPMWFAIVSLTGIVAAWWLAAKLGEQRQQLPEG